LAALTWQLNMSKCNECGSDNGSVVGRIGALETWRCGNCGVEQTVHVNDASIASSLPNHLEPVFFVSGRWRSRPSPEVIVNAKRNFSGLRDLSGAELMRRYIGKADFELGRFKESELTKLEARFLELGIDVTCKPIFLCK